MILPPAAVSSVSVSLGHWEILEYLFEGFVILACAGEVVADLAPLPRRSKKRLERISTMVLVVSLSLALIALIKTNELSGSAIGRLGEKAEHADLKAKRALADAEIATEKSSEAESDSTAALRASSKASGLASGARAEADSFEADIASAKRQAAEAESQLADATERTARLENQLSWRTVTSAQKAKLRKLLLSFGPFLPLRDLKIDISYMNQNPEAEEYAGELKAALDGLGAEIPDPSGVEYFTSKAVQGVVVSANPLRNFRATALLNALNNAGIRVSGTRNDSMDEHSVHIFVGSKPHK